MKCEVLRELLSGYLDGELDSKQKAELEKHLRVCEQCRNELEELKQLDQQVRASEIEEPSRDFLFQLNRRIMQSVKRKPRISLFRLSPVLVPIAAAALVLIVLLNIQQPTRLVSLDDRILYGEVETRKDLDLQIPELSVVEETAKEKAVEQEGKVQYRLAAKKREVVIAAEPSAVQDEAVGIVSVEALQIPADKIVRAIVDSTGRIVRVATGNTITPEKDTLLEKRLQGQKIRPPTVAGRRAQLYVDFTQKQEKE